MLLSRPIRSATKLFSKRVLVRGTATYEYRTYGDPDGPNFHLIQHLIQGVSGTHALLTWAGAQPFYLILEMQREEVANHRNAFKARAIATAIKSIHELDYPVENTNDIKNVGRTIHISSFMAYTSWLFRYLA
jgi:hypothetical protein